MTRERYVITVEPLASPIPVANRLRSALKCLLRSFGLRCVRFEPVENLESEQKAKAAK